MERYPEASDGREGAYPQWYRDAFHKHGWESVELDYVRGALATRGAFVTTVAPAAIGLATDAGPLPDHAKGSWRVVAAASPFVAAFLDLVGGKVASVATVAETRATAAGLRCVLHGDRCGLEECGLRGLFTLVQCDCFSRFTQATRDRWKNGHHPSCELAKRPVDVTPVLHRVGPAEQKRIEAAARKAKKDRAQRAKAALRQKQIRLL